MSEDAESESLAIWIVGSEAGLRLFFAELKLRVESVEPTNNEMRSIWTIRGAKCLVDRTTRGFLIWHGDALDYDPKSLQALYRDVIEPIASRTGSTATGIGPRSLTSEIRRASLFERIWRFGAVLLRVFTPHASGTVERRNDDGSEPSGAFVPVAPKPPNEGGATVKERDTEEIDK